MFVAGDGPDEDVVGGHLAQGQGGGTRWEAGKGRDRGDRRNAAGLFG